MLEVAELFQERFDVEKKPKCRVELHLHLDGSFRASTVWQLAKAKRIDLKVNSIEELKEACTSTTPLSTLAEVLDRFNIFLPVFVGDVGAIERAAFELCEDQAKEGVVYFETRYSPHILSNTHGLPDGQRLSPDDQNAVTPAMVVQSIAKGLQRGEKAFDIKARMILCCMRHIPEWHEEVLELCQRFKDAGVVGMDLAGDEGSQHLYSQKFEPESLMNEDVAIFQKASKLNIHRTVHAGEVGPAANVRIAVEDMKAERVGHGYRVLQDELIYQYARKRGVHFEMCPYSSLLTSAVSPNNSKKHPIIKFAEDKVDFSINKDDSLVTNSTLDDEYEILRIMGLTESHFVRANFNAARASFLPDDEKAALLQKLRDAYGVDES